MLNILQHISENEKRHRRDLLWRLVKFLLIEPTDSNRRWYFKGGNTAISQEALDHVIEDLVESKS